MDLVFRFGCDGAAINVGDTELVLSLRNPLLTGSGEETWHLVNGYYQHRSTQHFSIAESAESICGVGIIDVNAQGIRATSSAIYQELLSACEGLSIYRIWNFIPHINQPHGELDIYNLFCMGRAEAFEAAYSQAQERRMPAASAVGTPGDQMCIAFIAGRETVAHIENPLQVPAYKYPTQYGPRSPSFARAGLVGHPDSRLFISGTASIRNSESQHYDDPIAQTHLALENLGVVTQAAGLTERWQRASTRTFRAYVRDGVDPLSIYTVLQQSLLRSGDHLNVIQADICRPELLVEFEAFIPTA